MMFTSTKFEIGLALSGGGSRGLAHVGVLKALNEVGFFPQVFSGASMGAIIGAFFAAGYTPDDVLRIAGEKASARMFHFNLPKLGFTSHERVREILAGYLPETFEELKTPLYISTTNLTTGENQIFSSGPLLDPILASSSIPVIFKPVEIKGEYFVDGGLTDNLPTRIIRNDCKVLVGSHVNYIDEHKELNSIKEIAERCFRIAIYNTVRDDRKACDLFIDPPEVREFATLDFKNSVKIIELGYKAAKSELGKHPEFNANPNFLDSIKNIFQTQYPEKNK